MSRTLWTGRRKASERTADQAWEYLSSAVATAGDNARWARRRGARVANLATDRIGLAADKAGDRLGTAADKAGERLGTAADKAGDRLGTVADEAWQRANAAVDALAGRRAPVPWRLLVGVGVLGVALGYAAAMAAHAVAARRAAGDDAPASLDARYDGPAPIDDLPAAVGPDIEIVDVDTPAAIRRDA